MSESRKAILTLVVLLTCACVGLVGCGGGDPEPQEGDFDSAEIAEQADAERAADAAEPGVAGPDGEPTTSEGP